MLFMVIEQFKNGDYMRAGRRFREKGRMLPEGVIYHMSWLDLPGQRCFQVMEAPSRADLDAWIERWIDLVDFEVVHVETSKDFWSRVEKNNEGFTKSP